MARFSPRRLVATLIAGALLAGVAVASTASGATKPTIKIMVVSSWANASFDFPDVAPILANMARVENKKGGINGAQIEILSCNDKGDGNEAEKCARQAVEAGATALVGGFTIFGNRVWPALEGPQIPWIGVPVIAAADYVSPLSFPVTPGGGLLSVAPPALAGRSCKRVGLQTTDIGLASSGAFIQAGIKANQKDYVATTVIPRTATDLSQYAVQVQQGNPDCLNIGVTEPIWPQWITALKAQGVTGTSKYRIFTTSPAGLTDAVIKKFPKETEGWIAASYTPPVRSEPLTKYRTVQINANNLGRYKSHISGGTELRSYAGWEVFLQVARAIKGDVTPASLLKQLNSSCSIDTGGIVPTLNFCKENPIPELKRLFNTSLIYYVAKNGVFLPFGKGFTDMLPNYRRGTGK